MNATVATHRAASTRKVVVLAAMVALLTVLFMGMNSFLPFLLAVPATFISATVLLYVLAVMLVPALRPTRRR